MNKPIQYFKKIALLFMVFAYFHSHAQIIRNADFELATGCPNGQSAANFNNVVGWSRIFSPTLSYYVGTPDYYRDCTPATGTQLFIPATIMPHSGISFVGGMTELSNVSYTNFKEYIINNFSTPLQAGVTYTFSYYTAHLFGPTPPRLAPINLTYVDLPVTEQGRLGAVFSTVPPTRADTETPTTNNTATSLRDDFGSGRVYIPASETNIYGAASRNTWQKVTLTYTAVGGEQYMILGQFRPGSTSLANNEASYYLYDTFATQTDLAISKTDGATTYVPGTTKTYTVVARNNGPFAVENASVTDAVPAGIPAGNVSYTAVASLGSTTNVVGTQTGAINDLITLPVNGTVTYTVTIDIPTTFTGNLSNTATITSPSDSEDPDLSNNVATDVDTPVCFGLDSDGDGIPDMCDLDDDNDGILDTAECSNTIADMINAYSGGTLLDIVPSDFGLALNTRNQNLTRDLSAKFGYPANSGALIISLTNASVHPSIDTWWTKDGEAPSVWNVTGTMSAFVLMAQNPEYYGQDSKTIHIYDGEPVIPITVPGLANQTNTPGVWSVTESSTAKTLRNLQAENPLAPVAANGNWRYANMNFGAKHFGFSTTTRHADPTYAVNIYLECDTDGDGIPNRLDLDSDNDGCLDAIEGSDNVTSAMLVNAAPGLSTGFGSLAANQNLCAGMGCVDAQGVPTVVNPLGAADIDGLQGQGVGSSQDASVNACLCYKPGVTGPAGSILDTKVGISALGRAGATDTDNWPMTRKGGWIALEAKTKGFVPNRVEFAAGNPVGIAAANFVEGMMVYDTTNKCMKMYTSTDGGATFAWYCISTQTCTDISVGGTNKH